MFLALLPRATHTAFQKASPKGLNGSRLLKDLLSSLLICIVFGSYMCPTHISDVMCRSPVVLCVCVCVYIFVLFFQTSSVFRGYERQNVLIPLWMITLNNMKACRLYMLSFFKKKKKSLDAIFSRLIYLLAHIVIGYHCAQTNDWPTVFCLNISWHFLKFMYVVCIYYFLI